MNKEAIFNIFSKNSVDKVLTVFKRRDLVEMYVITFGFEPPKSKPTADIAYALHNFVQDDIRTRDLFKLL